MCACVSVCLVCFKNISESDAYVCVWSVCLCVCMSMSLPMCLYVSVSIHGHTTITNAVRSAEYFQLIPPLSAECVELDGDATSLPIIFEDVYAEQVIKSLAETTNQQDDDLLVQLHRSATVDSRVSCSSQVTTFSKQSRISRMSLASTASSASELGYKAGRLRLRTRPESVRRAGDSLVATDELDCTLVGYRKIDISCKETRPTVELGTLTSDHTHTQSLVGSGVVMQPSLLFNAVSLPTLHTNAAVSTDVSVSLTGSMPTLAANENSSSESDLTPYWQNQQGKAQLVAQHSNEATSTPCYFDDEMLVASGDSVNNVGFTLGTDPDTTVADDLDMTVARGLQRAVGNDLYMAEGVDLDTTVGSDLDTTICQDDVECNKTLLTVASCDSRQHVTGENTDVIADVTSTTSDNTATAVTSESTSTSAGDDVDATGPSLMLSAPSESSEQNSTLPAHVDDAAAAAAAAAESAHKTASTTSDVVNEPSTDSVSSLPPSSSSVTDTDNGLADKTSSSVICGKSCTVLSVDGASSNELKQSSAAADSDVNCVNDVTDELSVVIPSSCDSMSDDERYLSGQCTLLELISEDNITDTTHVVSGSAAVGADIAQRLSGNARQPQQQEEEQDQQQQQQRERLRAVDLNDIDVTDLTSERKPGAVDKSSKRLVSVVSDDMIHFIGAKEKLRKQLSYSGHFYRFLPHHVYFYLLFY